MQVLSACIEYWALEYSVVPAEDAAMLYHIGMYLELWSIVSSCNAPDARSCFFELGEGHDDDKSRS